MFASIVLKVLATLVPKVLATLLTFSKHLSRAGRQ